MQRGFSLAETALAVGIIAALLLTAGALSAGSRPLANRSAQTEFEAQLAAARSLAQAGADGATIIVQPRSPSGFKATLYGGRPDKPPLARTALAPLLSDADVSEAVLGAPPFAIFISGSGHISILGAYPRPSEFDTGAVSQVPSEPVCPASGGYVLNFNAGGAVLPEPLSCGSKAPAQ